MKSPLIFPSAHYLMHWHMKDLPSSAVPAIARTVSGAACFHKVQEARNEYILNAVEQSGYPRVALHYGSDHLFDLRPFLAKHGWVEQSLITLPDNQPGVIDPNK